MMAQDIGMQTYHHHTDDLEIRALIGLLYWWKQSSVNVKLIWDRILRLSVYRTVMPRLWFMFLTACQHFDNNETRDPGDKFAPEEEYGTYLFTTVIITISHITILQLMKSF